MKYYHDLCLPAAYVHGGETAMEKNVGGNDQLVRLVVGPLLVVVGAAALAGPFAITAGVLGLAVAGVLLLVGVILTYTGYTQRCFLNSTLGKNTYVSSEDASSEDAERGSRPS